MSRIGAVAARRSGRFVALALALCLASLLGGCAEDDSDKARAYREYLQVQLDGKNCCRLTEQQSLEHLERAVALDPGSATYRRARAGFLERLGRLDDALLELDRVIALEDSRYHRAQRGWVRCDLRRFGGAVEDFDRALGADPGDRMFLVGRALALVASGHPGRADADAELLVRDHSGDRDSHFVRAAVSLAQDRVPDAFSAIERALAVDKDAPHLYRLRSRLQERVGNRIAALADRATAELRGGATMRPCLDPFADRAGPALTASRPAPVAVELTPEVAGGDVRWPALLVVESTSIDRSRVDLGAETSRGARAAPAPDRIVLIDASGTHAGRLVVARESCSSPCGYSGGTVCHGYAEYAHDRGALALPALASADPTVSVQPISPAWRAGLQRQLANATAWPDAEPIDAVAAGYSIRVDGRSYAVLMSRFGAATYPGLWAWQGGRWHHRLLVPSYPTVCERR